MVSLLIALACLIAAYRCGFVSRNATGNLVLVIVGLVILSSLLGRSTNGFQQCESSVSGDFRDFGCAGVLHGFQGR